MGWENPVTWIVVPGFVGGLVIALVIGMLQRRAHAGSAADQAFRREPLSTDVINMAHIRVAGIGGLGLVAMAATVALNVPRVGQPVAAGMILGAVCGAVLIFWRRRRGPLPSSAASVGANTSLGIDEPQNGRSR
jgi:Na+/serine symporter